jgi:hypothetical protein
VDRAVFAEHPPMGDARTASWQLLEAERDDLLADKTFLQRMRAGLSLASFVRQVDKGSALATIISVFNRK